MKIRVTPAYGYAHGHAERVLVAAGASSISTDQDGIVTAEVTPQQFDTFQLRGVAHKAEVLPDTLAVPAIPQPTMGRPIDPNPSPDALKPDTTKLEARK